MSRRMEQVMGRVSHAARLPPRVGARSYAAMCMLHMVPSPLGVLGLKVGPFGSEGPLVPGLSCSHSQEQVWLFDY